MFDADLVAEIIHQILVAGQRIERRFATIAQAGDFLASDDGLDRLDGIAMMLIAIGENLKNLDKKAGDGFLARYPGIDWKGAKGLRDILSHNYFGVDANLIFAICREELPGLLDTLRKMQQDLEEARQHK